MIWRILPTAFWVELFLKNNSGLRASWTARARRRRRTINSARGATAAATAVATAATAVATAATAVACALARDEHLRHHLPRHHLRRVALQGRGLRYRRLPAAAGADRGRHPAAAHPPPPRPVDAHDAARRVGARGLLALLPPHPNAPRSAPPTSPPGARTGQHLKISRNTSKYLEISRNILPRNPQGG
eukprot:SAG31_NODE_2915_length_4917_cov_3.609381_7_plen_188_part_00